MGNTQAQQKSGSGKGKPSKASRSRHKKYERYKMRGLREFNAAKKLRKHIAANPNDVGPKADNREHTRRNPNDLGVVAKFDSIKHMLR